LTSRTLFAVYYSNNGTLPMKLALVSTCCARGLSSQQGVGQDTNSVKKKPHT